jgi:glycoprotein endo-alpha-1,2-mannosidase
MLSRNQRSERSMLRLAATTLLLVGFAAEAIVAAPTVGAYYYPWYGPGAGGHGYNDTLRMHLTPRPQSPLLGAYNSRSADVISSHIDQSRLGNISMWALSWWGPNSYEDVTIRNHIFKHPRAAELTYTIHYESQGRLGSFDAPNYTRLASDFRYLAENVFDDPNYMRIEGRPVIVLYLSRVYFDDAAGWAALDNLRTMMKQEYGYDPYLIGDHFFGALSPGAAHLDAVTTFDVYGQVFKNQPSNMTRITRLEQIYDVVQGQADALGVDFIPGLTPGYNDKAVRSGNPPAPRYLNEFGPDDPGSVMREMLEHAVLSHTDPDVGDLVMVNSFNEWHEDTQIEPTIITPKTNTDDSASGNALTGGKYYQGYGNLYLELLSAATRGDLSGDFNNDGRVDAADLVGPNGWRARFGFDLDGADLLTWQRNLGTAVNAGAVPEPCALWLAIAAFQSLTARRRR